ncbi:hypothetical protein ACLB2K_008141 [Fragaria x ananassa]
MMGGIGKTTLAKEVFKKFRNQFHPSGFVSQVRLQSEVELQQQCLAPGGPRGENIWGGGSRLIITTRDRSSLINFSVQENKIYEVEKLRDEEAFQLLCQKAFKKDNPPQEFVALSKSFLQYASGLPLAHEVLGSYLSRLKDTDKKLFLDIACFFNGEDYARVEKIPKGCGFSSRIGINILVNKCLVKIERDKLWMHDLQRCLGWHIVRRESPDHPGNRNRLWLDDNEHKHETRRSWRIEDARNVLTENTMLVEFPIPNSRIERLWDESVYQLNSLIHMDLSNCRCLTMTPDFSAVPNLETLILEGCTELSEVHSSTMLLQHLVLLNLKGCASLKELPDIIGLRCLRTFVFSGCTNLREFPLIADHMETLIELFLDGTAIEHLLGLSYVRLRGLTFLNLSGCENLRNLPFSITTGMTSLKFLYLSSCSRMGFEALPENIGLLEHLEELDVCDTPIREVPESISSLKNLKHLCFHGCSGLRLRYLSPGLTSLTTLNLGGCNLGNWDFAGIIGNLSSLQSLDLSENSFSSIPESICQLPELREISLRGCDNLKSLPGDPPASVKNVDTRGCTRLTNCSDSWQRLASDEGLRIRNCRRRDDRRPLMSLSVQFDEFHETPYPLVIRCGSKNCHTSTFKFGNVATSN